MAFSLGENKHDRTKHNETFLYIIEMQGRGAIQVSLGGGGGMEQSFGYKEPLLNKENNQLNVIVIEMRLCTQTTILYRSTTSKLLGW